MTVQVRLNRRETVLGRWRGRSGRSIADHRPSIAGRSPSIAGRSASTVGYGPPSHNSYHSHERRRAREAGPSQDKALYTCRCGFVFQALVSTSVGCPHCGGVQAW
jgi:hypothetical protein